MDLEVVKEFFDHTAIFVESLKLGEKVMREELDIDFDDMDEVSDNSNEYAFGTVEDEFYSLVEQEKKF